MPLGRRPKRMSGSAFRSEVAWGQPGAALAVLAGVWAAATGQRLGPASNARDRAEARAIRREVMEGRGLSDDYFDCARTFAATWGLSKARCVADWVRAATLSAHGAATRCAMRRAQWRATEP